MTASAANFSFVYHHEYHFLFPFLLFFMIFLLSVDYFLPNDTQQALSHSLYFIFHFNWRAKAQRRDHLPLLYELLSVAAILTWCAEAVCKSRPCDI